ncbi:MAG: hypothetical protein ABDH32_01610 [Candidatus Caldarchaeales archaeon]
MEDYFLLLLIIPIIVFSTTTLLYIFLFVKTWKTFGEDSNGRWLSQPILDQKGLERLRENLRSRKDIENVQSLIEKLRTLRKEVEEILDDLRRSKES